MWVNSTKDHLRYRDRPIIFCICDMQIRCVQTSSVETEHVLLSRIVIKIIRSVMQLLFCGTTDSLVLMCYAMDFVFMVYMVVWVVLWTDFYPNIPI
jgi:hypothetical protein